MTRLHAPCSSRSASVATTALKKDMDNKVIQGGKFDDKSTNAEREEHLVRQAVFTTHLLITPLPASYS